MAAVSLFRGSNMAAVTSCENQELTALFIGFAGPIKQITKKNRTCSSSATMIKNDSDFEIACVC